MNLLKDFKFNIAMEKIWILFKYFFNDVVISVILFIASIIYIFYTEKNKKIKDLFGLYIVIVFIIIWNPLFIHILEEFVNFSSLYRIYYMIPMYLVIAYTLTKIVQKFDKNWMKILVVTGICGIVMIFGKNLYDDWPLFKTNNLYKLPDETLYSAEVIYNDEKYENKKALVPYDMSSQIQQIHPSISLVYTRIITNIPQKNGIPSPADNDRPENIKDPKLKELIERFNDGDSKYIVSFCDNEDVNYIVVYDSIKLKYPLENMGFENIGADCGVTVYRRINIKN